MRDKSRQGAARATGEQNQTPRPLLTDTSIRSRIAFRRHELTSTAIDTVSMTVSAHFSIDTRNESAVHAASSYTPPGFRRDQHANIDMTVSYAPASLRNRARGCRSDGIVHQTCRLLDSSRQWRRRRREWRRIQRRHERVAVQVLDIYLKQQVKPAGKKITYVPGTHSDCNACVNRRCRFWPRRSHGLCIHVECEKC